MKTVQEVRETLADITPAQWIEALKSGKYRHTPGHLARTTRHTTRACCLGVLACEAGVMTKIDNARTATAAWPNQLEIRAIKGYGPHPDSEYAERNGMGDFLPEWLVADAPIEAEDDPMFTDTVYMVMNNSHADNLMAINDADEVKNYKLQIAYIEKYVVPTYNEQRGAG